MGKSSSSKASSREMVKLASKTLQSGNAGKTAKSLAGSVLAQSGKK